MALLLRKCLLEEPISPSGEIISVVTFIFVFEHILKHTDRFLVEMFHNYAFKECISVENLKLWLLILTKTLF